MKTTQIITLTLCLGLSSTAFPQAKTKARSKATTSKVAPVTSKAKAKAVQSMRFKAIPGQSKTFTSTSLPSSSKNTLSSDAATSNAKALEFYNSSIDTPITVSASDISSYEIVDEFQIALDQAKYVYTGSDDQKVIETYSAEIDKEEWLTELAPALKYTGTFLGGLKNITSSPELQADAEAGKNVLRRSILDYAGKNDLLQQVHACGI